MAGKRQKCPTDIGDILGALTDVMQPRSLSELVDDSLGDKDFDDA